MKTARFHTHRSVVDRDKRKVRASIWSRDAHGPRPPGADRDDPGIDPAGRQQVEEVVSIAGEHLVPVGDAKSEVRIRDVLFACCRQNFAREAVFTGSERPDMDTAQELREPCLASSIAPDLDNHGSTGNEVHLLLVQHMQQGANAAEVVNRKEAIQLCEGRQPRVVFSLLGMIACDDTRDPTHPVQCPRLPREGPNRVANWPCGSDSRVRAANRPKR